MLATPATKYIHPSFASWLGDELGAAAGVLLVVPTVIAETVTGPYVDVGRIDVGELVSVLARLLAAAVYPTGKITEVPTIAEPSTTEVIVHTLPVPAAN